MFNTFLHILRSTQHVCRILNIKVISPKNNAIQLSDNFFAPREGSQYGTMKQQA